MSDHGSTTTHASTQALSDAAGMDPRRFAETGLKKFFDAALRFEASDLILRGGQVPRLRLRGTLKTLDTGPIPQADFEQWIKHSVSDAQWKRYARDGSLDMGFDLDEKNRFRVNIFRTKGRSALAARRVSSKIMNFAELRLPASMGKLCEKHQGLVLLAGVTGSGKSTTIAAMLQHINESRQCHIITLEDPIEYMFTDAKSMVNQREIGLDVPDFPTALRALVRENPDVVLIGEMRDKETFSAALQAAETGHLVFGTIHASSASQAFNRIYDLFEANEREAIRAMLAYQMEGFVYQKLLPTLKPEIQRVPAVEILLQSAAARKYILDGRENELNEVIKAERELGMQTLNDSLVQLVKEDLVHPQVAYAATPNPEEVRMRLRGIKA